MMKRIFVLAVIMAMVLGFSLQANAALELRGTDNQGNRLIYDTDFNITWYDYTNTFNTWQNQMNWASALSVSGGDLVGVYDDWRLPTALNQNGTGPCSGYNCTGSEMGHLYFTEFGNKEYPSSGYGLAIKGDFQKLQAVTYWSCTEYSAAAWAFYASSGWQGYGNKGSYGVYAIAVRNGDVAVVPEPISSILVVIGGATLIGIKYFRERINEV